MKLTILLLALFFAAGCHKPKPKTPPPPCAPDLFGCWSEAKCADCAAFWKEIDARKAQP